MAYIYKNDDTASFGNTFITIRASIPEGHTVSLAKFKIGDLPVISFTNPTFPLTVNLTPEQTAKLQNQNECYLAVYDSENRKKTCKGVLRFIAKDSVVE